MARVKKLQSSFVAGSIGLDLEGRVDTDVYQKAASELNNVYVRPQGSIRRREGLRYIDTVNGSNEAKIVPFEFNDEQSYALVFTAGRFDVYKVDSDTLQASITTSPVSNITADILKEMYWTQSADTLYLVHKDLQPIKITRTSDTVWTATAVTFSNIPVFAFGSLTFSNPVGSVQPDTTTGEVTLTGTSTSFDSSYEGQFINMPKGGRLFVKEVVSATELIANAVVELVNTDSTSSGDWELETGYEEVVSATRGWFRTVAFYKGRLWLGGTDQRPQTMLASVVGEFENLDEGTGLDDQALNFTLNDNKINIVRGLFPGRGLQIFTSGSEYTIRSSINDPITPSNIATLLNRESLHGSGKDLGAVAQRTPRPISVDGTTIFVQKDGDIIRQFLFNETEQSFNAPNISIFAQHLLNSPTAMDIRRANSTNSSDYVYIVNTDGTVAVLNSLREQDLLAYTSFTTQGEFEDVAISGNKAFFIVKRSINGSDVRYLETLEEGTFMDSNVSLTSGSPTTSWSGLSSLEGEEVKLRGDDFILEDDTVSSGAVTSSESVSELEAGLPFFAKIKTLPLDVIIQGTSLAGDWKSAIMADIKLKDSRNILVEYGGNTYKPKFSTFGLDSFDQPIQLYSGWLEVYLGGLDRDVQVTITQEEQLEFEVIMMQVHLRF